MNENNKRNNNDERLRSSLSSSVKERAMENDGKQLQATRQKKDNFPRNLSSNGNVSVPHSSGLPSKNSIGSNNNGINANNREIQNKNALPGKGNLGNSARSLPKNGNSAEGTNSKSVANTRGQSLKNKVASKGLQAMGVPKVVSDSVVNSKMGKKAMDMAKNPVAAALNGIKNAGKSEAEKDAFEKEEEEQQKEKRNGSIILRMPLKVKLIIFLAILPSITFVIMFFAIITSYAEDESAGNIFIAKQSAKLSGNKAMVEFLEIVQGIRDDGMGQGNSVQDDFHERYQNLGNIYEYFKCKNVEECMERTEVKFFIKVSDIAIRYSRKYRITLDWELIISTILSLDLDSEEVFESFLHNYNYDDVDDIDILMDLDWDYDYKKIPGYTYLSKRDYRYDLQILAKNMVKKTTTQTCTKSVKNADGTISFEITKTQTDIDVEDQYLKPGQEYYLQCEAGETYDITSNYEKDLVKYDDFLLEYIEHKLYLQNSGNSTVDEDGNTDMTPSEAKGEYIFPLPSGATRCRSSAYGYRIHPITGERHYHSGDDYPAAAGTSVYAVADGEVISAGFDRSMGNYIRIDHGGGIVSIYMHASKLFVSKGDKVKKGDVIMAVGTTGSSTGNHLHISFKKNGNLDNPKNYIGALSMCS